MKKIFAIATLSIACLASFAQNATKQNKSDSNKCDTLILRQICEYCTNDKSSDYYQHLGKTTSCFCYSSDGLKAIKGINEFIEMHKNEIHTVIIENPSRVLFKIDVKKLNKINTLSLSGNDYDTDAIKTIPNELLEKKTFENVIFNGVKFPSCEVSRIKSVFPDLKFTGAISEYEESVDYSSK